MRGRTSVGGPSEVEVAGGYVLDAIRTERARNEAEMRIVRLNAELEAAQEAKKVAYQAFADADNRLHGFIRASVEA